MSIAQKVAHNTIIQFAAKVISIILGVAIVAIMTRYLGAAGFGQYSTVIAYLQLFAIIIDFGLALTIIKLIAKQPEKEGEIANNVLSFRLVSALIFLGLAPLVALFFPYPLIIKIGIAVTAAAFLFNSLNQILVSLFQKNFRMDQNSAAEIGGRVILLIAVIIAAYYNFGLLGMLVAQIVSSFITLAINLAFTQKWFKFRWQFDRQIWRDIILTTWPIAVTITFNLIYYKADTIILSLVRSEAEVGIYGATYRVLEILTQFPFLFVGLVFPILSAAFIAVDWDRYKKVLQKSFDFLAIVAIPMAIGAQFVAKPLMIFVAGPDFSAAGDVLRIIIIAAAVIFMNAIFGYNIVVINKQKVIIPAYIITAIIAVVGYLIFIPRYSYFGAAAMTVFSESLILFFNVLISYRATKILPNLIIFGKALLASLIMAGGLYLMRDLNLWLTLLSAIAIYLIALYLLKGVTKSMILEIIKADKV